MLQASGKNAVIKGDTIFYKDDDIKQIGIVLSGKVLVQSDCIRMERAQGSYLALNDINSGVYGATYTALEDSVIYAIPVTGEDTVRNIISKNADYRAIMISSQFKYAVDMYRHKQSLADRADRLFAFAKRSYEEYKTTCKSFSIAAVPLDEIEELQPYQAEQDINEDRMIYYEEGAKIPLSANKAYYSYSEEMVNFQVNEITVLVTSFKDDCRAIIDYIKNLLQLVALRQENNLYEYLCAKGREIKKKDSLPIEFHILLSNIISEVSFQYGELQNQIEGMPDLDIDALNAKMSSLATKEFEKAQKSHEEKEAEVKRDVESLKDSMLQILKYGAISAEDELTLKTNVEHLVKASDRLSVEDDVKKAKKAITPIVFKLYLSCYRRIREGLIAPPKAVELFMNYGMLDERLLDQEHLEFLCGIEPERNEGPCNVVTMMEWLDLIHEGKRDPSKSEFDENYEENLRTLKKQGDITEKEQKVLLNNMDKRVEYEIMNMQMSNSRTIYGQPSSYMPILYKEAIYGYLDNILVTEKDKRECKKTFEDRLFRILQGSHIFKQQP